MVEGIPGSPSVFFIDIHHPSSKPYPCPPAKTALRCRLDSAVLRTPPVPRTRACDLPGQMVVSGGTEELNSIKVQRGIAQQPRFS
ncbi:hypothetical protein CSOJ01_10267 [Colletotrichum sojae]|uniref:Uncharacterized protein n=1 Tax=Colletotrichum sojae TaxID=2175907 RepID=A0A8H6MPP0_9PEZI|nr:hypothetical protein CSOJ01_10267 [Colletotrichum sojae]